MKRMVAWIFYVLGGVVGLQSAIVGLASGNLLTGLMGIAYGIVAWWIAVGIGMRLGVTPDDFFASILSALGFGRRIEDEPKVTEDAPTSPPVL
jgi:hypothetical protein